MKFKKFLKLSLRHVLLEIKPLINDFLVKKNRLIMIVSHLILLISTVVYPATQNNLTTMIMIRLSFKIKEPRKLLQLTQKLELTARI